MPLTSQIAKQFSQKKKRLSAPGEGPNTAVPGETAFAEDVIDDGTEDFAANPHRRDRVGRRRMFQDPGRRRTAQQGRGIIQDFFRSRTS